MAEPGFQWPGRRAGDAAHDRVAAFLTLDIQRSPDWAEDLGARIAQVRSGALPSWERIGNAYRLALSAEGAVIEDLVDTASSPQQVSLDELAAAVAAWLAAIG